MLGGLGRAPSGSSAEAAAVLGLPGLDVEDLTDARMRKGDAKPLVGWVSRKCTTFGGGDSLKMAKFLLVAWPMGRVSRLGGQYSIDLNGGDVCDRAPKTCGVAVRREVHRLIRP